MGRGQRVKALSVAAGGVVASLALVACTGDAPAPQPDPPEPSESSTSAAPIDDPTDDPTEPQVEEPELPDAATEPTRQGAEAFVEYYVEVLNYAKSTGDAAPLRRWSWRCRSCEKYAELYETTYANGGYYQGMNWSVATVTVFNARPGFFALLQMRATRGKHADSKDSEPKSFEAGAFDVRFRIQDERSWRVTEIASV